MNRYKKFLDEISESYEEQTSDNIAKIFELSLMKYKSTAPQNSYSGTIKFWSFNTRIKTVVNRNTIQNRQRYFLHIYSKLSLDSINIELERIGDLDFVICNYSIEVSSEHKRLKLEEKNKKEDSGFYQFSYLSKVYIKKDIDIRELNFFQSSSKAYISTNFEIIVFENWIDLSRKANQAKSILVYHRKVLSGSEVCRDNYSFDEKNKTINIKKNEELIKFNIAMITHQKKTIIEKMTKLELAIIEGDVKW